MQKNNASTEGNNKELEKSSEGNARNNYSDSDDEINNEKIQHILKRLEDYRPD